MPMKASAMHPSRTLLDFGAGLLIGLSITVALFAAMEEDSAQLRYDMLLAALSALGLAIATIFARRTRSRRRRLVLLAGRVRDASEAAAGWTVERPRGAGAEARSGASSSNDYRTSHGDRTSAALPELKAAHRETQTTADDDTRRL
jgi:CRP-like cAMP-binding protein